MSQVENYTIKSNWNIPADRVLIIFSDFNIILNLGVYSPSDSAHLTLKVFHNSLDNYPSELK